MRKIKRLLSMFLAIALTLTMFSVVSAPTVEAKAKVKAKTINVTMYVGENVQLEGVNSGLTSKAKTSNKKVVKVSNKAVITKNKTVPTKEYRPILTAKKVGKANITYNMYYYNKKGKEVNCKVKVKITVKKRPSAPTVEKKYKVAVNENDACDLVVKWKQTKEFKEFKKNRGIRYLKYKITFKVDGKIKIDEETTGHTDSALFLSVGPNNFSYYDVYRVTNDTKMNCYGREGWVLTKIDTVFEMNKDDEEFFVNDKLTNQDSDDVMMFDENGEDVDRAFDGDGEPLYDNLWSEAKARNLIVSTTCGVYECSDGHAEYYKAGDIIKVRSDKSVTGKDVKAYVQAHPEIFEITVKPVSVKFCWNSSNKYFPACAPNVRRAKFQTLKY